MVENGILTHNYNHAEMNVGNYLLDKSMEKSMEKSTQIHHFGP